MIAPMKSVCASGRKKFFWMLLPSPLPNSPPEPIAIWPCTLWNPSPVGSAQGLRNDTTRAR